MAVGRYGSEGGRTFQSIFDGCIGGDWGLRLNFADAFPLIAPENENIKHQYYN